MDTNYDIASAAARLTEISNTRISNMKDTVFAASVGTNAWPSGLEVKNMGDPPSLRLIATEDQDSVELVLSVQGILVAKALPPITRPFGRKTKVAFLKQSVELCGFGSPIFENAISGIEQIDNRFRRSVNDSDFEEHRLLKWDGKHRTLELSNRYVTHAESTNGTTVVEVDRGIDPNGHLRALMGRTHVRTEDNVVEFYGLADEGTNTHIKIDPTAIKVGDIVEAQFSISSVFLGKRGGGKWRTVTTLRAVTHLDGQFTEAAITTRKREEAASKVTSSSDVASLKRKVGYRGVNMDTV
ncbi:hypothetical protein AAF712_015013 [Marasmius tenuissimus]|uniref:Uncharacterized protein n=1 Tax=Marasmius tenuissimus TaxID=585030 RepID=A0ABR2ZAI9_9AGAR